MLDATVERVETAKAPNKLTFADLSVGEAFVGDEGPTGVAPVFIKTCGKEAHGMPGWSTAGAVSEWRVKRVSLDIRFSVLD